MVVKISEFTPEDQYEVRQAEEAIRKAMKVEISDNSPEIGGIDERKKTETITVEEKQRYEEELKRLLEKVEEITYEQSIEEEKNKTQKSPEEILAQQLEDEQEKEAEKFTIADLKDYESGYDLGKLENLKKLIDKRQSEGRNVVDLIELLRKMVAEMDREVALNMSSDSEKEVQSDVNKVDLSGFSIDGEEGSFEELRRELLLLTADLLARGVLKIVEISKDMMDSEDGHDIQNAYVVSKNASEEDLKDANRLKEMNGLMLKSMGLPYLQEDSLDDEGNIVASSLVFFLPEGYDGERDISKITEEDIKNINEMWKEKPKAFEVQHAFTVVNNDEDNVASVVMNSVKSVTSSVSDMISRMGGKFVGDFTDIFAEVNKLGGSIKDEGHHKVYGFHTQHIYDEEHGGRGGGRE
ncbi:MAG: hypothetical protein KGQ36_05360 [Rickettsiales bacterium]|nr:hypothetical protein [Rickettsiales bacterium]